MKNEYGITLVALVITIILMLILATVSVNLGTDSLDDTRLKGFYTQLEYIQKRVDQIASNNENYIDSNGNKIYLKDTGVMTNEETDKLTKIINTIEGTNIESDIIKDFRYYTTSELEEFLNLTNIEYNVFINFENRIVIAEDGITIGEKTYYILENTTYFIEQNKDKNVGEIEELSYEVIKYGDKYKVTVVPTNIIGDLDGTGYVEYKKISSKYWEISNNAEIILELEVEYDIIYKDLNNNSIQRTIKVQLNEENVPNVQKL